MTRKQTKKVSQKAALQTLLHHLDQAQMKAFSNEVTRHLTRYWFAVGKNDTARQQEELAAAVVAVSQEYQTLKLNLETFEPLAKNVMQAVAKYSPTTEGHTIEEAMHGPKPGHYTLVFEGGKWRATKVR